MKQRPLLDRLYDLQHALKLEGWTFFEKDVEEAIIELQRRTEPADEPEVNAAAARARLAP